MKLFSSTVVAAVTTSFAVATSEVNKNRHLLDLGEPCDYDSECESQSCFIGMMIGSEDPEDVGDMPPGQCVCNTVTSFPCNTDFSSCSPSDLDIDGPPYCFLPIHGNCEFNEECKSGFCDPEYNACKCNQYLGEIDCNDEDSFFDGGQDSMILDEMPPPGEEDELFADELPEIFYDEPEGVESLNFDEVQEESWEEGEDEDSWSGDESEEEEEEYWIDEEAEGEEGEDEYWIDEEVENYEDEEAEEDEEGI